MEQRRRIAIGFNSGLYISDEKDLESKSFWWIRYGGQQDFSLVVYQMDVLMRLKLSLLLPRVVPEGFHHFNSDRNFILEREVHWYHLWPGVMPDRNNCFSSDTIYFHSYA